MFDLHTVHLKSFCSLMCPLNVFQTYIKNFNRKFLPWNMLKKWQVQTPKTALIKNKIHLNLSWYQSLISILSI